MSNPQSPEYIDAMEAMDHFAHKYGFQPTQKERQLFWLGVRHGLFRGQERAASKPVREKKPLLKKGTVEMQAIRDSGAMRFPKADSSVIPGTGTDLNEGGVFRL